MKLGFSLLSLFMKDVDEMLSIAEDNGFDSVELLAEGPYRPDIMLGNKEITEVFHSYDLDIYMHAVNVDIMPEVSTATPESSAAEHAERIYVST